MALFQDLNEEGSTVVIVTHEHDIGAHCKRVVKLKDGLLESDSEQANPRRAISYGSNASNLVTAINPGR